MYVYKVYGKSKIYRPLAEKKADFREKLSADNPSFRSFVIGEYHLKNKNIPDAIEAYKRCVSAGDQGSALDDWFINKAKRKLNELLNENTGVKSYPNVNDDE